MLSVDVELGAVAAGFLFKSRTVEEKLRSLARMASDNEVNMNTKAVITVNLLKKFAGPRLPNTVWLEPQRLHQFRRPSPIAAKSRQS